MSVTFTKLFSSITESTIWREDDKTRILWITMLAMADRKGRVWASVPGLADRARISLPDCVAALNRFMSPDEWSRTKDNDGIRIAEIDGGWVLLNYDKYRAIRDQETIKETNRNSMRKARAKKVDKCVHSVPQCIQAEAEAEAEADNVEVKQPPHTARGAEVVEEIRLSWNKLASECDLTPCRTISTGRRTHLNKRLKEADWLDSWQQAMEHLKGIKWIRGSATNGWKANFDWFIRPDTVAKILEGAHDDRETGKPKTFDEKRDLYQAPEGYDGPFA